MLRIVSKIMVQVHGTIVSGGACGVFAVAALFFTSEHAVHAQISAGAPAQPMITAPISETNLVRLSGNTRPEANAVNDRGMVADNLPMEHLLLQLRRPPAQEQALTRLIDQLHDPASPNYHKWLTPDQIGAQFGPAASDIARTSGWLQSHGFRINVVYPNGMVIDFSGTAGQVRTAFHAAIHNLSVDGVAHIANTTDPQIPAALAPAVIGVVSLHDFRPHPGSARNPASVGSDAQSTTGGNYYVTPPDLATIYNFNPVFNAGNVGQNQTIYLIEDSDLYSANDWTTFRSGFGIPLSSYPTASLTTVHPAPPSGSDNCSAPGVNGDGGEAILDAEYASAAAPGAAIVMATCKDTSTSGLLIAMQNVINGANPPAIISMSYIDSEPNNGAAANAAFNIAYQTGVAAGISIFVCAGDEGAAVTDYGGIIAAHGITANGMASTSYNVAVGGTDFSDTYSGTNSTYWNSTNTPSNGSAKSYIPEIPWNTTCGSQLFATYQGFSATYGSTGFCNGTYVGSHKKYLQDWAGSGGPSACATGTPSIAGVVSGTCEGYPKPSWQTGVVGIPNDGVRGLPDVSLFASFGPWKHGYVICYSDPTPGRGGVPCDGTASGWSYDWGGTSFASPIMAGIQALINQNTGLRQGNPNYRLYQLAAGEYGANGSSTCNSSNGNAVGNACIFYDVTLGDMDVPCKADSGTYYDCYRPSGTYGVMSTSNSSYSPAFGAATGWDFATGIGSVNVANLVTNWATMWLTATPATGGAPLDVTFSTLVAQGDTNTYTINFGDGTSSGPMGIGPSGIACTASGPCYSAMASTAHTYTAPATYTAILLNSASAGVATAQIIVVPSSSPPGVGGRAPQGAQPVRLGSQGCDSFADTAGCAYRR